MQFFISLINGIRRDTHIASLVELRDLGSGGKLEELREKISLMKRFWLEPPALVTIGHVF